MIIPPSIETEQLIIRRNVPEDFEPMRSNFRDDEVTRLPDITPEERAEASLAADSPHPSRRPHQTPPQLPPSRGRADKPTRLSTPPTPRTIKEPSPPRAERWGRAARGTAPKAAEKKQGRGDVDPGRRYLTISLS